jgi:opacity protein-like surface antigen
MNRSMRALFLAAALAVAFTVAAGAADAADPLEGTWDLNVEKSIFKSAPGPKGQTRTYALSKGGVEKMTARGVSAEKKPTLVRYEARYDGKDYDITGSLGGDKIMLRRIDALTTESTQKRDGKAVIVATRKVSSDGKTLTVVSKGTLADGQVIDSTLLFERR